MIRLLGLIVVSSSNAIRSLIFRRLVVVDLVQAHQLRPAIAATRLPLNPHAIAQIEAANDFRRDEDVLRRLDEIAFRVAQEPKTLARDLDHAFTELRLALHLAVLEGALWVTIAIAVPISKAALVLRRRYRGIDLVYR